jgi:hypothetical protein
MPSPLNVPITPPRVAFIDERTGNVSREWYLFFLSLFQLTGGSSVSLGDVQKGPPPVTVDEINQTIDNRGNDLEPSQDGLLDQIAQLAQQVQDLQAQLQNCCDALEQQKQIQDLQVKPQPELGTMSSVQQDNVRYLGFSLEPSPEIAYNVGEVAWNSDDGTLDVGQYNGTILQVGQETQYYARNTSGVTVNNGTPVMFTGTVGASGKLTFGLAVADGSVPADYMMGVATQTIPNNGFGYITHFGLVRGFNTTGSPYGETWADGDLLYFDPATPGTWTNVQPQAPNIDVPVAVVVNAGSGGSGSIFVRMTIAEALSRLQDVYINGTGTPLAGEVLIYDATQARWENNHLTAGSNISITNGDSSITIAVTGLGTMAFENTGASGTFTAASGEVVTVTNGVVTSIV